MKKIVMAVVLAAVMGPSVPVALHAAEESVAVSERLALQQERLGKYAMVRSTYDPAAVSMLLGNAELGGLATPAGTGFLNLYAADLFVEGGKDAGSRSAYGHCGLTSPQFPEKTRPTAYRQELRLVDGVVTTRAEYGLQGAYEAELFCSMANKHLVVLRLKNAGGACTQKWDWNASGYTVSHSAPDLLWGVASKPGQTPHAWALRCSKPWQQEGGGVELAPGETVMLTFTLVTKWDDADFVQRSQKSLQDAGRDYSVLLGAHQAVWTGLWRQAAVVTIPEPALEELWYRSLFWTLCTCGSERFLPGEAQFAVACWGMYPFTYGAAGWGAMALINSGFPTQARTMLDWHFQPKTLHDNAESFTSRLVAKPASPDAMAFAHESFPDGHNRPSGHYELQRHIDGFGGALFYRYNAFYPDPTYQREVVYPVLRGVAEFYRGLLSKAASGELILPKLTSLSENLVATHVTDAALAARWSFMQASSLAAKLGVDKVRGAEWGRLAQELHLPQNAEEYLEFFGDDGRRPGGGYMGIRGPVYLAFPTMELIPQLDGAKAQRTLEKTWMRNREGEGMIGFVANWFALADAYYGRSEHALKILRYNLKCLDHSGLSLRETPGNQNIYFNDNYTSFLMVPLAMAVQSYDNRIAVCPAVPEAWKDFAFYNVPAEAGVRVSGAMKNGVLQWSRFEKDGKELLQLDRKGVVEIHHAGGTISLERK